MDCVLCPRKCKVDRNKAFGFCEMGKNAVVAKACLHFWEEPCISGNRGSGTVFFSGCNLKCKYCQNYTISQENFGQEISVDSLKQIYLKLQNQGAHNINLVNPTHFNHRIKESLSKNQLRIPIVYNSNAYETSEALQQMEGLINIYLPDCKYYSSEVAQRYSGAEDYFKVASAAILEMSRQVGESIIDQDGIMQKGLIIRHLILPGLTKEAIKILDWIKANLPEKIYVSLMSQYTPYYKAECYPEINRRITRREYEKVLNHFYKLGFENGFMQERDSAEEKYIPDFNLEGV